MLPAKTLVDWRNAAGFTHTVSYSTCTTLGFRDMHTLTFLGARLLQLAFDPTQHSMNVAF